MNNWPAWPSSPLSEALFTLFHKLRTGALVGLRLVGVNEDIFFDILRDTRLPPVDPASFPSTRPDSRLSLVASRVTRLDSRLSVAASGGTTISK
jgi:hypothetical protein